MRGISVASGRIVRYPLRAQVPSSCSCNLQEMRDWLTIRVSLSPRLVHPTSYPLPTTEPHCVSAVISAESGALSLVPSLTTRVATYSPSTSASKVGSDMVASESVALLPSGADRDQL